MSSGKSLIMSKYLFMDHLKGRDIIANYDLAFTHEWINKDALLTIGEEQPNFDKVSFGLDEFWLWIDSRSSMGNKLITYFLNQTSKDDINLYATTQDALQIDIRFRKNMHKLTVCHRMLKTEKGFIDVPPPFDEMRILPNELNKVLYIKTVEFRKQNIGLFAQLVPVKIEYHKADILFNLFNTRGKVKYK